MTNHKDVSLSVLRLYFPVSRRAEVRRFWHHLSAPELSRHLLNVARQAGIMQVIMHPVTAGYLPGARMSHHHPETVGMRHPVCIELLDTEEHLREFMSEHTLELSKVHMVLFNCEVTLAGSKDGAGLPV